MKLPLYSQIFISFMIMIIIAFVLILTLSLIFAISHLNYLFTAKKEYFLTMQQNIIENNILFIELCFYQYEQLIKVFNYQIYLYLKDVEILKEFARINYNKQVDKNRIFLFNNPDTDDLPEYNAFIPDEKKKLYNYCYSNDEYIQKTVVSLIYTNYLSFLNQLNGIRNFRIPFYGNITLEGEFLISFIKYNTFLSINNSRIKEVYQSFNGDMNRYLESVREDQEWVFSFYKEFFENFQNNQVFFFDLMYQIKFPIFSNYNKISNNEEKVEYIKNNSIYFQRIYYASDATIFYDTWNTKDVIFRGVNSLIINYIDFLLFHLVSKIDIYILPFNHRSNYIISKNLCYFLLLKQIIFLEVTKDNNKEKFNQNFINKIYDELYKNDKLSVDDCKIEKYLGKYFENEIDKSNFYNYYDVRYKFDNYIYLLRNKDEFSLFFQTKNSYPNYLLLKDIFPFFFCFHQIDFMSFSFGYQTIRTILLNPFYNNVKYLMSLCLLYNWMFIIFIFVIISSRTIIKITDPIIKLTETIDLNNLNEKNINEKLFEYNYDEEINKFFLKCKKLINGEINEINYKNKEMTETNNNINNNMIINNKMILELIENQKNLNNDDKEIFLLNQVDSNLNDLKKINNKTKRCSKLFNQDELSKGLNNFGLIKLTNTNNENNNLISSSKEIYSEMEERDPELEKMNSYENLLNLADYVYNGRDKEKINYQNKLRMNIYHTSTNANLYKLGSVSKSPVNDKIDNEIKNIRKDCKYITYYWYINAKKNKSYGCA